jgi:predicted unusual protein kinase regulating ubiquinone biosynthesis (AarF/ABC1/UbiB family)
LIQEYVYGKNIYEIGHLEEKTRRVICASVYEFIFQSMCDLGTFHGDMHPGNLLFFIDSPCVSSTDDFTVNFIDYGITYQVEEGRRMKIMKVIWMLTEVDDTEFFDYLYDNGTKETPGYESSSVCKEKVVTELVELRKTYDIFRNTIKPMDVYYANKVLNKYNLRIHPEFSRAFMFLYSMCSLMSMLQSVDMTLYQKCLKVYFAMNHEKLKQLS